VWGERESAVQTFYFEKPYFFIILYVQFISMKTKLTVKRKTKKEITPLVKSLSGIIKPVNKKEERKVYADYLSEKYK
jgi:hypothetical protein